MESDLEYTDLYVKLADMLDRTNDGKADEAMDREQRHSGNTPPRGIAPRPPTTVSSGYVPQHPSSHAHPTSGISSPYSSVHPSPRAALTHDVLSAHHIRGLEQLLAGDGPSVGLPPHPTGGGSGMFSLHHGSPHPAAFDEPWPVAAPSPRRPPPAPGQLSSGGLKHLLGGGAHAGRPGDGSPRPPTTTSGALLHTVFNMGGPFPPPRPTVPATSASRDGGARANPFSHLPNLATGGRLSSGFEGHSGTSGISVSSGDGFNSARIAGGGHPRSESVGADPFAGQVSLNLSTINTIATDRAGLTPRTGRRAPRASSAPLTPAGRTTVSPAATHRSVGASSEAGSKKRRKRNEQQQMNNKIAQQRYREKQKAKTKELQDQVELLQGRLAWLEAAGAEDDTSDPAVLRARLQAQAARIQELEGKVAGGGRVKAEGGDSLMGEADVPNPLDPAAPSGAAQGGLAGGPTSEEDATIEYSSAVGDLRAALRNAELPEYTVLVGDPRYESIRAGLQPLLGHALVACIALMRHGCMHALPLPGAEPEAPELLWPRCLLAIALDQDQVQRLVLARSKSLQYLRSMFVDRQRVSTGTTAALVASPRGTRGTPAGAAGGEAELDAAAAARMALLESSGAFPVLRLDKDAEAALDRMRDSLRKSRHWAAELCQFVLLQVLRPEQAAVLLATAYPSNIDALALINALAATSSV